MAMVSWQVEPVFRHGAYSSIDGVEALWEHAWRCELLGATTLLLESCLVLKLLTERASTMLQGLPADQH